jgi:arylsulfatase A-like enzyme
MNLRGKYTGSLSCLIAMGYAFSTCSSDHQNLTPPNIVWITSEDNSAFYLKMYHEDGMETPNIEFLAQNGIKFNRAFSNAPVCSAARSTLISGCYGPRIASHFHRRIELVPMPDNVQMFPAYLREAGYYTTNNVKEDYNIIKSDNVWDESSNKASWRNRQDGQPFFHVQNTTITHEGRMHFSKEDMKSIKTRIHPDSVFIQPNHPDTEIFRYSNAFYRDKIAEMDKEVGRVVEELRKDGLMENTIIFYYSDHGGVLPGSKGYIAETGLHVPFVVYIPENYKHLFEGKAGSESNGFVSFVDFGATVLNLAGLAIPEGIDGKPFLGRGITAKELASRDESYSYADRFDEKYDMVRAVRKGKIKYIRNYQPFNYDGLRNDYRYKQLAYTEWFEKYSANELNETQAYFFTNKAPEMLFDVEADFFETNNLAENPEYAEVLKEMRAKLDAWLKGMPDLAFYPEHHLIEEAFDNPVEFGQAHKENIHKYIEISNLVLSDFNSAKPEIEKSLRSEDPWERYWGILVSGSFGKEADVLKSTMKEISLNDTELINRVRAAEFLAINLGENPYEIMNSALYSSTKPAEALLILNSMVLMRDRYVKEALKLDKAKIAPHVLKNGLVGQRVDYLM